MTDTIAIQGILRPKSGTSAARSLKRAGQVPAVVYGKGQSTLHLALPSENIEDLYERACVSVRLIELHVEGKKHTVLPKQFSVHPVTNAVQHVDFMFADHSNPIKVKIPVRLKGKDKSPGIKKNGLINLVFKTLPCKVCKDNIPQCIEIDVTEADIGFMMTLADLKLPDDVKLLMPSMDQTLMRLTGKRKVVEEIEIKKPEGEAAAAEGAAEGAPAAAAGAAAPGDAGKEKAAADKSAEKKK